MGMAAVIGVSDNLARGNDRMAVGEDRHAKARPGNCCGSDTLATIHGDGLRTGGTMEKALLVGLGGFLGSVLRYGLGGVVGRLKAGWTFPLETLLINVAGCLVLGLLAGLSESRGAFTSSTRAFLFIGLLGGFTTFSTYGYETFQLMRDAQWQSAALSTILQVGLGIGGLWAGDALARLAS
jgi:CrcB protein